MTLCPDQSWKRRRRLKTQATHEKEINYIDVNTMSIHLNLKKKNFVPIVRITLYR